MHQATIRQQEIIDFLKALREEIIAQFESFEPTHRFLRKAWPYHSGEGGGKWRSFEVMYSKKLQ